MSKMRSLIGLLKNNILELDDIEYQLLDSEEDVRIGGSSFVYKARQVDGPDKGKVFMIKELCPEKLHPFLVRVTSEPGIGEIRIADNISESEKKSACASFKSKKKRAKNEIDLIKQLSYLENEQNMSPWYLRYRQPVEKNNTLYTVIDTESGETLEDLIKRGFFKNKDGISEGKDFVYVCNCILKILDALEPIHEQKYLHLDIAPDNILFPKFKEDDLLLARIIDYNSATKIDDFADGWKRSFKEGYSAPELWKSLPLSEATDLYSIAAVFFRLLVGRPLENDDLNSKTKWQLNNKSGYLAGASNLLVKKVNGFLLKGLSDGPKNRFPAVHKMRTALVDLRNLYLNSELIDNRKRPYDHFAGREMELAKIQDALANDSYVFLEGMGGIGKSELAKRYATLNSDKYDIIQFITFKDDLQNTIADNLKFRNFNYEKYLEIYGKNKQERVKRIFDDKMSILKKYVEDDKDGKKRTALIIIDNYDVPADDEFHRFVSNNYKVILTSRERHTGNVVEIDSMESDGDLFSLFNKYYYSRQHTTKPKITADDEPVIRDIINLVLGHTMTVMLIASTMRVNEANAKDLYEKLSESLDPDLQKAIAVEKEEIPYAVREDVMYRHVLNLFNMEQFDDDECFVMANMALISYTGLEKRQFLHLSSTVRYDYEPEEDDSIEYSDSDYVYIDKLIKLRWIQHDEGIISLHPVISDVAYQTLEPDCESCAPLIDGLHEKIDNIIGLEKATYTERNECLDMVALMYKRLAEANERIFGLSLDMALVYLSLTKYDDAEACCKRALEISKLVEIPSEYVAFIHNMLINIKHSRGEFDADDIGKFCDADENMSEFMRLRKLLNKCESPAEAFTLYISPYIRNFLQALFLGQYDEALKLNEIVTALLAELYKSDYHPEIALALKQKGNIYDKMGQLDTALNFYFEGLSMYSHFHPDDEYGKSGFYSDIGLVCLKQAGIEPGKANEAKRYMDMALAAAEERDGDSDAYVVKLKYNKAIIHLQMGEPDEAHRRLLQVLEVQKIIFKSNPYHEDLGNTHQYIGFCCAEKNDHETALKHYNSALEIYRKAYELSGSDNHRHMFELFTNSGMSYIRVGNAVEGIGCAARAFVIAKEIFRETDIDMATAHENMGRVLYAFGIERNDDMVRVLYAFGIERTDAVYHLEKSMAIYAMYYPPNHPHIISVQEIIDELKK